MSGTEHVAATERMGAQGLHDVRRFVACTSADPAEEVLRDSFAKLDGGVSPSARVPRR
jgi:hypothetical protein